MALDKIKTDVIADNAVTSAKLPDGGVAIADLATDTGITTNYHKVPAFADDAARDHNTTGIPSPAVGMLIYNTDKGVIQQYNAQGWASVDSPPTVSSLDYPGSSSALDPVGEKVLASSTTVSGDATVTVSSTTGLRAGMTAAGTISGTSCIPASTTILSVTNSTTLELSANASTSGSGNVIMTFNSEVLVITGTNFQTGLTVTVDNTAPSTVTRNSSSQITITGMPAKTAGTYADGLKVTNPTGLAASINVDYSGTPAWTTASGNLLDAFQGTISEIDLVATGDAPITYAITSGALPTGLSMATADGDITGNMTAAAATYNFTVTATDAQTQTTPRLFNIISKGAVPIGGTVNTSISGYRYHVFTADGTFTTYGSVSCDLLIIGGGAGGGATTGGASTYAGGGGAGGFVQHTSQSIGAGAHTVDVGDGGAAGSNGSNSSIAIVSGSTLSALGGGAGNSDYNSSDDGGDGADGGSGGGGGGRYTSAGTWTGGTGSQGNNGGSGHQLGAGGGGGAGSAGSNATGNGTGGAGGHGENNVWSLNDADSDFIFTTLNVGHDVGGLRYFAGGGGGSGGDTVGQPNSAGGDGGGGQGASRGGSSSAGTANTGGGGGGGRTIGTEVSLAGGSGIIIIRYAV